jgi:hypothetical protein
MVFSRHNGYSRDGRRLMHLDMGGDAPPPPDYSPVAAASEETARIGAELGREQLAEGKRQYDQNMLVAKPVVDAQLDIMKQGIAQGNDYFDYLKTNARPVEAALNTEAMAAGSDRLQTEAADRAVADVRQGTTASQNQIIRQGLRYGFNPAKLAGAGGTMAASQGLAEATAANSAREKEKSLGFAKKLDVAGLYRGLPGASTGAYQVATGAGNSAVANQGAGGAAYLGAMGQGANTTMQGRQVAMQGLTGVLNAQTSYANTVANSSGGGLDGIGSLLGGGARLFTAFGSHPDYKQNIERVGNHPLGIGVYDFEYREEYRDKWGHGRQRGVMATEVQAVLPEAVKVDADGHTVVDYSMLVQ